MKKIMNMSFLEKVKICLISIILIGTLAFTNAFAGQTNIGTIQYNGKNTLFATKTETTARTGAKFTLTNGSSRRIILTTFSGDLTNLYQAGLVVRENDPFKSNTYIAGKPSGIGTKVAISYGDFDGGSGLWYSTSGYIRYY